MHYALIYPFLWWSWEGRYSLLCKYLKKHLFYRNMKVMAVKELHITTDAALVK